MNKPALGWLDPLPAAISSLIDGAVATFDLDREASRNCLQRASALLRARWNAPSGCDMSGGTKLPAGLASWQVNRVLDYIEKHLPRKVTVRELAHLINVSQGWFARAFKISVGVSPYRFVARRRLELAYILLRTTREPLSQVAISCGMHDQAHFSKTFRRATGMSPAAWRRANAIDPGPSLWPAVTPVRGCPQSAQAGARACPE